MTDVKIELEILIHAASEKANNAIKNKGLYPNQSDFFQGQYQAFGEMVTLLQTELRLNSPDKINKRKYDLLP